MKKYMARIYVSQGDKSNIDTKTFEKAVELLNVNPEDEKTRVKWLNIEDVYFKGTKNYIRIIN